MHGSFMIEIMLLLFVSKSKNACHNSAEKGSSHQPEVEAGGLLILFFNMFIHIMC